ncbi:ATP-binding protein [uncultured Clostridium sp.]|uniref:ATP-binding protein n=1 Tax=uncultured Clostridium sp. TaxID=59620 RepID=UPI002609674A|nr:ATP-binding protein [uncultured Clostridium sp.]
MLFDNEEPNKEECWFKNNCKRRKDGQLCEDNFCLLNYKMNELVTLALLSNKDKYPIALFTDADGTDKDKFIELKQIQTDIKDFVNQGKNLFIYSNITGNGKSAWAKKLLLSWFQSIIFESEFECRGLYISLPRFFSELRNNINEKSDYIQYVNQYIPKVDLIVWDEIGIKNLNNWEHEIILNFINLRIEAGKANIFTSNMNPEQIRQALGDRLYSRIVQTSKLIELKGKDKRALRK